MKLIEELKSRFAQLTDREQKLVLISAVVIVVGFVWFVIYSPLQTAIEQGQNKVKSQQELLTRVTQNANKAIQLKQSGGGADGYQGSLPQAVNQTATRQQISITRMQPQGDDIQVWIDNAEFNSILSWLQALENMGIKITEADITEGDSPGNVRIRRLRLSKI